MEPKVKKQFLRGLHSNNLALVTEYLPLVPKEEIKDLDYVWMSKGRDEKKCNDDWKEVMVQILPTLNIRNWGVFTSWLPCPWMAGALASNPGWDRNRQPSIPNTMLMNALHRGKYSFQDYFDELSPYLTEFGEPEWYDMGNGPHAQDAVMAQIIKRSPNPNAHFIKRLVIGVDVTRQSWVKEGEPVSPHEGYPCTIDAIYNYAWNPKVRATFIAVCLKRGRTSLLNKYKIPVEELEKGALELLADPNASAVSKAKVFMIPIWPARDSLDRFNKTMQNHEGNISDKDAKTIEYIAQGLRAKVKHGDNYQIQALEAEIELM